MNTNNRATAILGVTFACVMAAFALFAVIGGFYFGVKAIGRYQGRQDRSQHRSQLLKDASNDVVINSIRIRSQAQKVKIAQQDAQIRYVKSIGIRKSQDEISKTLTPLYVQFEMISALEAIATSGKNATVVYIPTGTNGLPITATSGVPGSTTTKP